MSTTRRSTRRSSRVAAAEAAAAAAEAAAAESNDNDESSQQEENDDYEEEGGDDDKDTDKEDYESNDDSTTATPTTKRKTTKATTKKSTSKAASPPKGPGRKRKSVPSETDEAADSTALASDEEKEAPKKKRRKKRDREGTVTLTEDEGKLAGSEETKEGNKKETDQDELKKSGDANVDDDGDDDNRNEETSRDCDGDGDGEKDDKEEYPPKKTISPKIKKLGKKDKAKDDSGTGDGGKVDKEDISPALSQDGSDSKPAPKRSKKRRRKKSQKLVEADNDSLQDYHTDEGKGHAPKRRKKGKVKQEEEKDTSSKANVVDSDSGKIKGRRRKSKMDQSDDNEGKESASKKIYKKATKQSKKAMKGKKKEGGDSDKESAGEEEKGVGTDQEESSKEMEKEDAFVGNVSQKGKQTKSKKAFQSREEGGRDVLSDSKSLDKKSPADEEAIITAMSTTRPRRKSKKPQKFEDEAFDKSDMESVKGQSKASQKKRQKKSSKGEDDENIQKSTTPKKGKGGQAKNAPSMREAETPKASGHSSKAPKKRAKSRGPSSKKGKDLEEGDGYIAKSTGKQSSRVDVGDVETEDLSLECTEDLDSDQDEDSEEDEVSRKRRGSLLSPGASVQQDAENSTIEANDDEESQPESDSDTAESGHEGKDVKIKVKKTSKAVRALGNSGESKDPTTSFSETVGQKRNSKKIAQESQSESEQSEASDEDEMESTKNLSKKLVRKASREYASQQQKEQDASSRVEAKSTESDAQGTPPGARDDQTPMIIANADSNASEKLITDEEGNNGQNAEEKNAETKPKSPKIDVDSGTESQVKPEVFPPHGVGHGSTSVDELDGIGGKVAEPGIAAGSKKEGSADSLLDTTHEATAVDNDPQFSAKPPIDSAVDDPVQDKRLAPAKQETKARDDEEEASQSKHQVEKQTESGDGLDAKVPGKIHVSPVVEDDENETEQLEPAEETNQAVRLQAMALEENLPKANHDTAVDVHDDAPLGKRHDGDSRKSLEERPVEPVEPRDSACQSNSSPTEVKPQPDSSEAQTTKGGENEVSQDDLRTAVDKSSMSAEDVSTEEHTVEPINSEQSARKTQELPVSHDQTPSSLTRQQSSSDNMEASKLTEAVGGGDTLLDPTKDSEEQSDGESENKKVEDQSMNKDVRTFKDSAQDVSDSAVKSVTEGPASRYSSDEAAVINESTSSSAMDDLKPLGREQASPPLESTGEHTLAPSTNDSTEGNGEADVRRITWLLATQEKTSGTADAQEVASISVRRNAVQIEKGDEKGGDEKDAHPALLRELDDMGECQISQEYSKDTSNEATKKTQLEADGEEGSGVIIAESDRHDQSPPSTAKMNTDETNQGSVLTTEDVLEATQQSSSAGNIANQLSDDSNKKMGSIAPPEHGVARVGLRRDVELKYDQGEGKKPPNTISLAGGKQSEENRSPQTDASDTRVEMYVNKRKSGESPEGSRCSLPRLEDNKWRDENSSIAKTNSDRRAEQVGDDRETRLGGESTLMRSKFEHEEIIHKKQECSTLPDVIVQHTTEKSAAGQLSVSEPKKARSEMDSPLSEANQCTSETFTSQSLLTEPAQKLLPEKDLATDDMEPVSVKDDDDGAHGGGGSEAGKRVQSTRLQQDKVNLETNEVLSGRNQDDTGGRNETTTGAEKRPDEVEEKVSETEKNKAATEKRESIVSSQKTLEDVQDGKERDSNVTPPSVSDTADKGQSKANQTSRPSEIVSKETELTGFAHVEPDPILRQDQESVCEGCAQASSVSDKKEKNPEPVGIKANNSSLQNVTETTGSRETKPTHDPSTTADKRESIDPIPSSTQAAKSQMKSSSTEASPECYRDSKSEDNTLASSKSQQTSVSRDAPQVKGSAAPTQDVAAHGASARRPGPAIAVANVAIITSGADSVANSTKLAVPQTRGTDVPTFAENIAASVVQTPPTESRPESCNISRTRETTAAPAASPSFREGVPSGSVMKSDSEAAMRWDAPKFLQSAATGGTKVSESLQSQNKESSAKTGATVFDSTADTSSEPSGSVCTKRQSTTKTTESVSKPEAAERAKVDDSPKSSQTADSTRKTKPEENVEDPKSGSDEAARIEKNFVPDTETADMVESARNTEHQKQGFDAKAETEKSVSTKSTIASSEERVKGETQELEADSTAGTQRRVSAQLGTTGHSETIHEDDLNKSGGKDSDETEKEHPIKSSKGSDSKPNEPPKRIPDTNVEVAGSSAKKVEHNTDSARDRKASCTEYIIRSVAADSKATEFHLDHFKENSLVKVKYSIFLEGTQERPAQRNMKKTLHSLKARILTEARQVHGAKAGAFMFADYWKSLTKILDGTESGKDSKSSSVISSFLKTRKLRRLHNKFILGALKLRHKSTCAMEPALECIPDRLKEKIKLKKADSGPRPLYESTSYWLDHRLEGPQKSAGETGTIAKVQPTAFITRSSGKSQVRIAGALTIDPLVRNAAAENGLSVPDNAVWLLVVAAREYATTILKSSVEIKKSLGEGKLSRVVLSRSTILQPRLKGSEASRKSPGGALQITSLDIHTLMSQLPIGPIQSLGGTVSRSSLEANMMNIDSTPCLANTGFARLRHFIASSIAPSLSSAGQPKKAAQKPATNPTKKQELSPHGGLGRGAKDLAALRARSSFSKKDEENKASSEKPAGGPHQASSTYESKSEGEVDASKQPQPSEDQKSEDNQVEDAQAGGRRGKGSGVKNLRAMLARNRPSKSEQPNPTQGNSGNGT